MKNRAASGIMLTLLLIGALTLAFNIQTVEASLTVHNIDSGEDFATIQEAIDDADTLNGHTILVDAGTYHEHVVVNKPISLIGENRSTTIIDGSETGIVVTITANNVSISGFTMQNSGFVSGRGSGISLHYSNWSAISSCLIVNNFYGILLWFSDWNTITNNSVESNDWWGIATSYSVGNIVTYNHISSNAFDAIRIEYSNNSIFGGNTLLSNGAGINLVYDCFHNMIDGNVVGESESSGVGVGFNSNNNTIHNNTVFNNQDMGVWITNSNGNNVTSNTISKSGWVGMQLISNFSLIKGNNITDNEWGIWLWESLNNNIFRNDIVRNNMYGVVLQYSKNNTFCHNNFTNNTQQVYIETSGYANYWDDGYPSGGNYWSDYSEADEMSGPSQDQVGSDGIGDTPYDIDGDNQDNYPLIYPWSSVERKVGVEVGDWVKYSNFDVSWSSSDPDMEMPMGITLLKETEWWENSVEDILDTKIKYQQLFHFKNGSEYATTCWINIETASGTPVSFISSGLNPSDNLYSSAPWFAWKINETLPRSYIGVLRETNRLNITAPMQIGPPPPYPNSTGNFYWDRETGVLCELSMKHLNKTGSDVTSWSVSYEIVDTNLWEAPIPTTIGDLKTEIEKLGSEGEIDNQGIVKSLTAKLNLAQKSVGKGKIDEAKSVLEDDFIPQVQNLSGIHITVEAADILIKSAEHIISHL